MTIQVLEAAQAMARLDTFGAVIDARSPSEYAEDHLPGAVNWPVLDDDERRRIGTEYKQISPFDAQKRGAALVARNIARHIEAHVMDRPKSWHPLVYCWRGGKRSGALAWFLDQMGFRTHVLEGGYKAYRTAVIVALQTLPERLDFEVVCGKTGSGKTRLLGALRDAGAQVLDLEGLARHRGSVLGILPDCPQPSQKAFDTALWNALRGFDPARPVFVESEGPQRAAVADQRREAGTASAARGPDHSVAGVDDRGGFPRHGHAPGARTARVRPRDGVGARALARAGRGAARTCRRTTRPRVARRTVGAARRDRDGRAHRRIGVARGGRAHRHGAGHPLDHCRCLRPGA